MKIRVFGSGCARCQEAAEVVVGVVRKTGVAATVEKVTDLQAMMMAGILSTPAVAVDGKIMCTGRVPAKEEVAEWINTATVSGTALSCACQNGCCS